MKKLIIGGSIAVGLSISLLSYIKYKDIKKWRAEEECIPYPSARFIGQQ